MAKESTIQIYNSVAGTTAPSLEQGELAFAGGNDKLFIGKNGGATAWIGALILDEDNLSSDSADALATQQSIKAYVDAQVVSASSSGVATLNGFTGAVAISADHGVTFYTIPSVGTDKVVVRGVTASTTQIGVAKFNSSDFAVTDGEVTFTNRYLYIGGDNIDGGETLGLGATLDLAGGEGIVTYISKGVDDSVTVNIAGLYAHSSGNSDIKGIAKYNTSDFSVTDGLVDLADSVVKGVNTPSGSVTPVNNLFGLSGGTAAVISGSGSTASIAIRQASTSQLGVASFDSTYFSVGTTGHVTMNLAGGDIVTAVTGDTATGTKASRSGDEITISGITASDTQMGTAKYDSGDFLVNQTTGTVALANSASGAVLTINGSADEVDVSRNNGTVTVGLPTNVGISGGLTVGTDLYVTQNAIINGNLTVNGTTTTVDTANLVVEDPLIRLAFNNTGNAVDIGFVGKYVTSSTAKYTGLYRDYSDGKWHLFHDSTANPNTDVDTGDSGYTVSTLVANINAGTF